MLRREAVRRGVMGALMSLIPARLVAAPRLGPKANGWVGMWFGQDRGVDYRVSFTRPGCHRSGCLCGRALRVTAGDRVVTEKRIGEGESAIAVLRPMLPISMQDDGNLAVGYGKLVGMWTALYARNEMTDAAENAPR